jgi:hypothetical protein
MISFPYDLLGRTLAMVAVVSPAILAVVYLITA